jgi:CheY-like chemotaxis protein
MSEHLILVAEDDENDVILIERAFAKAGSQVSLRTVRDGELAVRYLAGSPPYVPREDYPLPVLMLLDLKMPKRSGLEVLAWVRGRTDALRRLPVVILTSSREAPDVNRAFELGASSYLVKPVAFEQLVEVIRTLNLYWLILGRTPEVH